MKNINRLLSLFILPFLFLPLLASGNAKSESLVNTYATFNCGSGGKRCYAFDHQDVNHLLGAQTSLVTVPLSHNGNAGLLGDVLWMFDDSSPQSSNCYDRFIGGTADAGCWIEIGETSKNAHASLGTYVYWSDVRPRTAACLFITCDYQEHPKGTLHNFGSNLYMSMYYVSPGTWQVRATGAMNFSQQSTANGMAPNGFEFGSELQGSGTSGVNAAMPTALFYANQYLVAGSPNWNYVTAQGIGSWSLGSPNNPPWGGWRVNPSAGTGGGWYTCIKSSKWNGSQYPNPC